MKTVPRRFNWSMVTFGLLACGAAIVSACSGSIPSLVPQSTIQASNHRRPVHAYVVLRIPKHRHRWRHGHNEAPDYVSPAMASLSVAVQPIAASSSVTPPTPMPLQTFNVATPSPCSPVLSSSALECQFTVSVMPGSDSFIFKTYSRPNAGGALLSGFSSAAERIPASGALGFTLEGAVSTIRMIYPSPASSSQPNVIVVPVGTAAPPVPISVAALDAAGYEILEPSPGPSGTYTPYLNAITLSVTPADGNVTLANNASSGTSLRITDPSGLKNITENYNGGFTVTSGVINGQYTVDSAIGSVSLPKRRFAVAGTPVRRQPAVAPTPTPTAPPNEAVFELASHNVTVLPSGASTATLYPSGMVVDGTGKNLYGVWYNNYPSNAGAIASVSAASGASNLVNTTYYGNDEAYDPANNALWVADTAGLLHFYDTSLVENVSSPFAAAAIATVSVSPDGQLWYGDSSSSAFYQRLSGQCAPSGNFAPLPAATSNPIDVMVPGASTGVAVGMSYIYNNVTFVYDPGAFYTVDGTNGWSAPVTLATPDPTATYGVEGLRKDASGNIYASVVPIGCALSPCTSYIGKVTSGTMTTGTTIPYGDTPGHLAVSPTQVAFLDSSSQGIGLWNLSTNAVTILPLSACGRVGAVAFDANQTLWVQCSTSTYAPELIHLLPTNTWTLFAPSTMPCGGTRVVGIGGAQPADSFNVSATGGFSGSIAPSGTEALVTAPTCGSSSPTGTITVTETNSGRTESVTITGYSVGIRHFPAGRGSSRQKRK